ncbi:MAG: low temperature requirement protein A [Acidimicrobiia bacterium]
MARSIIRPPRLRTTETATEHRSATWLELFYDLVFVVAVAALGHRLLVNVSWTGFLSFVGLFIPLWWAWAGFTFYADRYDTDDLGQRVLAVAQMVAIALMAVSISGDVADSTAAFALAYVGSRSILILMYLRARRHVPETRDLVTGYIKGFGAGAGFWLASILVPPPGRFVLWGVGLTISFATPYLVRKLQAKAPLSESHLPERFGLFTILVLGESIAAVVAGLSHEDWELRPTLAAVLGVLIATGLWWLYFDALDGSVVRRRRDQSRTWRPTVWIYSHLPLVIALITTGIGLEFVVSEAGGAAFPVAERWLLAGGVAASLLAMGVIQLSSEGADPARRYRHEAQRRFAGAGAALLLGLAGGWLPGLLLAVFLAALCAAEVGADVLAGVRVP